MLYRKGVASLCLCENVPVFNKVRKMFAWKPERVADGQNPEDGELVQHLSHEAQGHVEVYGEQT